MQNREATVTRLNALLFKACPENRELKRTGANKEYSIRHDCEKSRWKANIQDHKIDISMPGFRHDIS
jgi:hypothetical protein